MKTRMRKVTYSQESDIKNNNNNSGKTFAFAIAYALWFYELSKFSTCRMQVKRIHFWMQVLLLNNNGILAVYAAPWVTMVPVG